MFLFSIAIYIRSKQILKTLNGQKLNVVSLFSAINFRDIFLLMMLVFLLLYFRLPDSDSSAGFISVRMNLMVFLFLLLWSSSFKYPKWIIIVSFTVLGFSQFNLLKLHNIFYIALNNEIAEIMVIEKNIKANTVILPLNYSDNWTTVHNSNYLGINKPVIILENHECNNSYFPLSWKTNKEIIELANSNWTRMDEILKKTSQETLNKVDYIFIQGKNNFPDSLKTIVLKRFILKDETEHFSLYEKTPLY